MKKIAITGALGHIGSKLIRVLPGKLPEVELLLIDNMLVQRYCSLFDLPEQGHYRFIEADILQADLEQLFEGCDAVVHLAAITNAAGSFDNAQQVEETNFIGTCKVAEACVKTGAKLISLSTTSVYGTQEGQVDEWCSEDELKPQSPYAESKLKAEHYLESLGERLDFVTLRFGTIFGYSIGMRFHTAVNKFCFQAVMGQPLTVWKTAYEQKRPYLDLHDATQALIFILKKDIFDRQVYNVLTLNATVHDIVDVIRKDVPDLEVKFVETKIMNQLSYDVSNERFKSLGFVFSGHLERSVGETIAHLKNCNNLGKGM